MSNVMRILKAFAKWGTAALLSLVVAWAVMVVTFRRVVATSTARNGEWTTVVLAGDRNAGPYERAAVAMGGLLAATRRDSIYYAVAGLDGEPFRVECDYRVEGTDPDAGWWSITAYGPDRHLIPNPENRYSYHSGNVEREPDGSFVIHVSSVPQEGNWLPVRETGARRPRFGTAGHLDFDLLLRLYTPGEDYLERPDRAPLPRLFKGECR